MITELRTYTIKRGMMASWLEAWRDSAERSLALGIRVEFAGFDRENMGTFVWLRTFRDEADRQESLTKLYGSDWWKSVGDQVMSHVVNYEVRVLHTAFVLDDRGQLVAAESLPG